MPRAIPFYVCDSFTDTPFAGNPAGVFFDDSGSLTAEEMRLLAAEVHLESAFVLPPARDAAGAAFRLRYFTSVTEIPLCGHATVAALAALARAGRAAPGSAFPIQTAVGALPAEIGEDGTVTLYQNPPAFLRPLPPDAVVGVARALGLAPDDIAAGAGLPVRTVSTGTPWLLVPVRSRSAVDAPPADFVAIAAIAEHFGATGMYVFAVERATEPDGALSVWSRCYAPGAGLIEDPVTGSASGALGGCLAEHGVLAVPNGGSATFTVRQGFAGGRGGTVRVTVRRAGDGAFERVAVAGRAVVAAEGVFALE